MALQIVDEVECSRVELVGHVRFSLVEHLLDLLLVVRVRQILFEDLDKRGALDHVFQPGNVGTKMPCDVSPYHCILVFGVDESAIEIEKCCFKIFHISKIESAKIRNFTVFPNNRG